MKTQGEIKQDEIIANLRAIIRHCDSPESNNPRFEMVLELTKKDKVLSDQLQIIKGLSGEKIPEVETVTSTEYPMDWIKPSNCFMCGGTLINGVCDNCTKELCSPLNTKLIDQIIMAAHKAFPSDDYGIPDSHTYSFAQGAEWAIKHFYLSNKATE